MNRQQWLQSRKQQKILCIILTVALIAGMVLPLTQFQSAPQSDPLDHSHVHDIETLRLGDSEDSHQVQSSSGGSSDSEDARDGDPAGTAESLPEETKPQEDQPKDPGTGDGDEGQEDGNTGDEGGQETQPDLAVVMTWYKYGSFPKTVVCAPSEAVQKTVNTAQLKDSKLKYDFSVTGKDASKLQITGVSVKAGDGAEQTVSRSGSIRIELADAHATRDYTFRVDAQLKIKDDEGKTRTENVSFTYVVHCRYAMDLEMELNWQRKDGTAGIVTCAANQTAARTIQSSDLSEPALVYNPVLTGALEENARITKAEYRTASGQSGAIDKDGGSLPLQAASGADRETYYLTFEAALKDEDGQTMTVYFHYTILYIATLDVKLQFNWLERGAVPRQLVCQPNDSATETIKTTQLSAGALKYELALTGADCDNARILNVSYTSEAAGGGALAESGALPMELPDGIASNFYTIRVSVLAGGQQLQYEIRLKHTMDVALQMRYTVLENGVPAERSVLCENGSIKTAEVIYDDQLTDGMLEYTISGSGESALTVTSITCYQSGSGSTLPLNASDTVKLLLKGGKPGENTFTITAQDGGGAAYTFKISIPYKHRGEKAVQIATNLIDGQVLINETKTNLSVNAWTEDASGGIADAIPANGTDTKLIVKLDDEVLQYVSTSGTYSEYILFPENPDEGDINTHTLSIYAEDAYGNYGELILTLQGQRNQAGQKKGEATIVVDMTVLGLGIVDSIPYEVLVDEPISYAVAKGVLGMDTGDPFGAAEHTLGWQGRYAGTLDIGFYLQSLTPGHSAKSLTGNKWSDYGSTEEEILQSIDRHFGRGTGLATIWRCIYRNGLNKSGGSNGSYGEFDFTSGSGWIFAINGSYYPGQSMSSYYLENGGTLTLRYTLAYGWDVGSGSAGYGNTVGYCVTAVNGGYSIKHRMEPIVQEGETVYACKCCGLLEECTHERTVYQDLDDGTHVKYCLDCETRIGDPENHRWKEGDSVHQCKNCGAEEAHVWKEVPDTNTATCTEPGVHEVCCVYCKMTLQEDAPAAGHKLENRWNHTKSEHYQKCAVCKEVMEESTGRHQYKYNLKDEDWYCEICEAGHDWDYCGNDELKIKRQTCLEILYFCDECEMELPVDGDFPEYHDYQDGICIHCGESEMTEPEATEPETTEPEPTRPESTEPEATEPTPTEPKPEEPTPTEPKPEEPKPTEPKPVEPAPTVPAPPVEQPPAPSPEEEEEPDNNEEE